jgi:hypothetical protein
MTETLGPDEKRCPFCAEVVRAAAIKCRYCQSDLPVTDEQEPGFPPTFPAAGTAHDIREQVAEPEPADEAVQRVSDDADPAASSAPELNRATVIMLALCLAFSGGIVGLVLSAKPDGLRTADNGQVTSEPYRSAALSAASANAAAVLSYSYDTLDADEKAARSVITASFAKEYEQAMAKAGPKATSSKLTLKATVVSSSLISIKKGTAKVLLFVNAVTTAEGAKKQQLNQNRVLMTMTREDGDWVVSKLDAF